MSQIHGSEITIEELLELYKKSAKSYGSLVKLFKQNISWNENKDVRLVSLKLIAENLQAKIIILNLIEDHYTELKLWNFQKFPNQEIKLKVQTDRLYFILEDLKGSVYINIFMQFEHFIRIIGSSISISNQNINQLSKNLIRDLGLNADFENLIDLITYSRNTLHHGGIHTKPSIVVTYESKSYEFKQGEHLSFFFDNFLHYLIEQISILMKNIIESPRINSQTEILHTYATLSWIQN